MKQYSSDKIKNVALCGHGGSGKTSLAEAMLFLSGAIDRQGKVSEGNTFMDFDPEEKRRVASVSTAIAPLEWKENKINLIDTPGMFDFAGGLYEGIRAAETVLIVLSGKSGVTVGAQKAFKAAVKANKAKMFYISKMNSSHADYNKVLNSLRDNFGAKICPVIIPIVEDHKVVAYVNLINSKRITYPDGTAHEEEISLDAYEAYNSQLREAIAGVDEELMEKFFSGERFTMEEKIRGLNIGVKNGDIYPVFCGSGEAVEGIGAILDGIHYLAPSPVEHGTELAKNAADEQIEVKVDKAGPLAAVVFKTVADPFVGKLSFFKVIRGELKPDMTVLNTRSGENQKVPKLLMVRGAKQEDVSSIVAGDIGAVAKMGGLHTGDTICDLANPITLAPVAFPNPCISMAVRPKKKGDEEKIAQGLTKLMGEDPTISHFINNETHEQILSGLGDQHLDVIVSKLKSKYGVEVELSVPRVAYRETIRKPVKVQGRHKKQSGGHGQFGDVWIEFSPVEEDGLVFEEKIFGGSVPKNYFPAVEKGLRDSMVKGPLAGYPVVGIKAVLVDGSYHPVDSSEMAFKTAASIAFKAAFEQANPTLLEPFGTLTVLLPDDNLGDIMGDVTKRRGRVLGMNPTEEGLQELTAEVPIAEMGDFSTTLRSITQGRGTFSLTFERYEQAPNDVVQKVIEAAQKENAD